MVLLSQYPSTMSEQSQIVVAEISAISQDRIELCIAPSAVSSLPKICRYVIS